LAAAETSAPASPYAAGRDRATLCAAPPAVSSGGASRSRL